MLRAECTPQYFVTPLRLSQMMEVPLAEVSKRVRYGALTPDAYAQTGATSRTPLWTFETAQWLAAREREQREADGQMRLPQ